jgi:hypothetical protein
MRVTGLILIGALSAACSGAATDDPRQQGQSQRDATGATGESATGLSEPRIASPATADETTAALADFKQRVDAYAELHEDLARGSAKQRETKDAGKITDAQAALAARVQAARPDAKQGDLFTPAVRPIFRRLLAPELKGADGRETRAAIKDDAPAPGTVPFKVNAKYPAAQPLPTVPANVLASLPVLPPPLQYRIVGQHLLLLDTASGLIADYMPNAITR